MGVVVRLENCLEPWGPNRTEKPRMLASEHGTFGSSFHNAVYSRDTVLRALWQEV